MIYTYANRESPTWASDACHDFAKPCALEMPEFPFEQLSEIAELESWRKEVNRPIYHIHKWWAQRLGSVFRGILIAAMEGDPNRVMSSFFSKVQYPGAVVFDPFMGSGTTVGESVKLGMRSIGRDINQVAYFAVRNALGEYDRDDIISTFHSIEQDVSKQILHYYQTQLDDGTSATVLYYFWVKTLPCPFCLQDVDLFSTYVFARHAYPNRYPKAQAICPHCGEVNECRFDIDGLICQSCSLPFEVNNGPVRGSKARCPNCTKTFQIAETIRESGQPPAHRLYAKLVLLPDGTKVYQRATPQDQELYDKAAMELNQQEAPHPIAPIQPGHNTNQVLNYGYRYWHEMFNARQLLGLSVLADRIGKIDDAKLRDLFACLFSGTLEFNNMFASYKGEGTGAVRHMFAHHILKPERTPLEANLWGTPKSSGAFSTLFRSRLLRALDYRTRPFEIAPRSKNGRLTSEKVYDLSQPVGQPIADSFAEFRARQDSVYLSCGDSAFTDIPSGAVDLVVTDPPFFDNVHYSELADFFQVWQKHILSGNGRDLGWSTRSEAEVQSQDPHLFSAKLGTVFSECLRVLRPDGLLIFTYHHSRQEGWHAIQEALGGAGFVITAVHPVKSELSVAAPKSQASSPIDIDVIFVCRNAKEINAQDFNRYNDVAEAIGHAENQVRRMRRSGRALSRSDVRVIVMAQLIRHQSWAMASSRKPMDEVQTNTMADEVIDRLYSEICIRDLEPA